MHNVGAHSQLMIERLAIARALARLQVITQVCQMVPHVRFLMSTSINCIIVEDRGRGIY